MVRAAIAARKRITEPGAWKLITGTSKMPKTAFPIGTNYPVTFTRNWHWRVDRITGPSAENYRLLTAFNGNIEEFRAWFALEIGKSTTLLARYEFHGSHPGWHCHAPCDDVGTNDLGALRTRGCRRFPLSGRFHRSLEFDTTSEERALTRSFLFYRIDTESGGLL